MSVCKQTAHEHRRQCVVLVAICRISNQMLDFIYSEKYIVCIVLSGVRMQPGTLPFVLHFHHHFQIRKSSHCQMLTMQTKIFSLVYMITRSMSSTKSPHYRLHRKSQSIGKSSTVARVPLLLQLPAESTNVG